ncbi:MAG: hypothetical protein ACRYGP_06145 [Janthinobacterium lividum]
MADPFDTGSNSSFGAQTARAKDDLNARFQGLRRDAAQSATSAAESIDARLGAHADPSSIGEQASDAADEAKGMASSIAEQARARLNEIVDQQKAAGADKIAGVAKAAHSAADNLDQTNPHMARLVRSAADNVDKVAEDFRSRDIGEVLATVADFGRRQPVAFFGGAVLAGFLLSRFFKSDVPLMVDPAVFTDRRV